jgi:signal transduction histidine kinase
MSDTDVIRNFIHALAQAVNLDEALEIVLVNLREVLEYDRAGLFILDKNYHLLLNQESRTNKDRLLSFRKSDDPIITLLAKDKKPLIVKDIQLDSRFKDWADMNSIRSWIGAPLFIKDKLIGFLSIGSLKSNKYRPSDGMMMQSLASQIVLLMEKTWLHDQITRKTEELEGITSLSIALGQAEGHEFILETLFEHIGNLFGAKRCLILLPDHSGHNLIVRYGTELSLIGASFSKREKTLWDVFISGDSRVLTLDFSSQSPSIIDYHPALVKGLKTAVIGTLKSGDIPTGILFIGFENSRDFERSEIYQFNFISEFAGISLERALLLENLEKNINTRSSQLSILYDINTYASKQLQLDRIIEKILMHFITSLDNDAGAVYLQNQNNNQLELVAHQTQNKIDLCFPKWLEKSSSNPELFSERIRSQVMEFDGNSSNNSLPSNDDLQTILTPIYSKNAPIGVIVCVNKYPRNYSKDDSSLFNAMADQLGIFIERARLISKAEDAAVIEERQRLARDLHDSITQLLYSQVLFAGAGRRVLHQNQANLTEQYLNRLENLAQQALKEMRLLVYELVPVDHLEEGLYHALKNRLDTVEDRSGIEVQLIADRNINLGTKSNFELYQIAQEALNNTLKHSSSRSVIVKLNQSNGHTILEIIDDGCGFTYNCDSPVSIGNGIKNMRERSQKLGGNLAIETSPGNGTKVTVTI